MAAIEIRDLRKTYKDVTAVEGLDLTVEEGELFALLGVNGAGKTTTVKMLATLTAPTGGDALICGRSVTEERSAVKKLIDISLQETAVARKLTVEENLDFYAALSGLTPEERERSKEEACATFGLDEVLKRRADRLSGGWQRKLSVALALISRPRVLFLDEPTLGMDVLARRELWRAIEALKGKMTVVLTTHYMEEAQALADRIGVMKDGRLLFVGSREEMYARTGTDSVEEAFIRIVEGGERDA